MQILTSHHANLDHSAKITTTHGLVGQYLIVDFNITTLNALNTSDDFSRDHCQNIGLWEYDVVEVFVQKANGPNDIHEKYLELQISPLGQIFALHIDKPRMATRNIKDFSELSCTFSAVILSDGFRGSFKISLDDIPGKGDKLFGNFFTCLGVKEKRSYFALNINKEDTPDFHRPDLFVELANLKE